MTRRMLSAWLCVLPLTCLVLAPRADAKPPDLPDNPDDIVKPQTDAGAPAPLWPVAAPPGATDRPTPPRVPASAQRRLNACLLFGVHPLLLLAPVPEPDEDDEQPEFPTVPLPFGKEPVQVAPNCPPPCGMPTMPPSQIELIPVPPQMVPCPPPAMTCPYHFPSADRQVPLLADPDVTRSVESNLEKLIEAEKLYQKACQLVRDGKTKQALKCLETVCRLCPGSRYEEMVAELVQDMVRHALGLGEAPKSEAEEEETVPLEEPPAGPAEVRSPLPVAQGAPGPTGVEKRLATPVSVNLCGVTFREVLDDLQGQCGVKLVIDKALSDDQLSGLKRVTNFRMENVKLKAALDAVMSHAGLAYVVEDNTVVVTSRTKFKDTNMCLVGNRFVPHRVGQIFIIGNKRTKMNVILREVGLYPGQILSYPELRLAERNLVKLGIFMVSPDGAIRPKIDVVDNPNNPDSEYKDVYINVVEADPCGVCRGLCEDTRAGVAAQVKGLMKACHLAVECGRLNKAMDLAREIFALDSECAASDPLVAAVLSLAKTKQKCGGCCEKEGGCCCEDAKKDGRCPATNPPGTCIEVDVPMNPPQLPSVDPGLTAGLENLVVEGEVGKAKPSLEVVEESAGSDAVPRAVAKPYGVTVFSFDLFGGKVQTTSFDDLFRFLPGEVWTELDVHKQQVRLLWRVTLGGKTYRVRYDHKDGFDLSVTPLPCGDECCEEPK